MIEFQGELMAKKVCKECGIRKNLDCFETIRSKGYVNKRLVCKVCRSKYRGQRYRETRSPDVKDKAEARRKQTFQKGDTIPGTDFVAIEETKFGKQSPIGSASIKCICSKCKSKKSIKHRSAWDLLSGKIKGCVVCKGGREPVLFEAGHVFDSGLVVIKKSSIKLSKNRTTVRCHCGKVFEVSTSRVSTGKTTQCRKCAYAERTIQDRNRNDEKLKVVPAGTVVADGAILVLEDSFLQERKNHTGRWHVFYGECLACGEGKKKIYNVVSIQRGNTTSCGCLKREALKENAGCIWAYEGVNGRIHMRSSWELAVAHRLDELGIAWQYEPTSVKLQDCEYWPDFYFVDEDRYVEVKGWIRPGNKNKADELTKIKNIETWFKDEVESFVGLSVDNLYKKYLSCRVIGKKTTPANANPVTVKTNGKEKTFPSLRKAADSFGQDYHTVHGRVSSGWSLEDALTKSTDQRPHLTEGDVVLIKKFLKRHPTRSGRNQTGASPIQFLRRWFSVSKPCIVKINNNHTWKHIKV